MVLFVVVAVVKEIAVLLSSDGNFRFTKIFLVSLEGVVLGIIVLLLAVFEQWDDIVFEEDDIVALGNFGCFTSLLRTLDVENWETGVECWYVKGSAISI